MINHKQLKKELIIRSYIVEIKKSLFNIEMVRNELNKNFENRRFKKRMHLECFDEAINRMSR